MNNLTKQEWKERAMLLGRIMEALSNVTDLPILRETLTYAEEQKGRAIGHAIKARKERTIPQRSDTATFDPDAEGMGAWD